MITTTTAKEVWTVELWIRKETVEIFGRAEEKFVAVDARGEPVVIRKMFRYDTESQALSYLASEIRAWNNKYQGKRAYNVNLTNGSIRRIGPS